MWLCKTMIFVASAGLLGAPPALAEAPAPTPILAQMVRGGYLKFDIVAGRITVGGRRYGNISTSSTSGTRSERLTLRASTRRPSFSYQRSTAKERLAIEVTSGGRLRIRRTGKDDATIVPVEFHQAPNEPTSLTVGPDGRQQVYQARHLWHLLMIERDVCQEHLLPILELLRPDWQLAKAAEATETALLLLAAAGEMPDRQRWATLVEQLADDRFSQREAADRQLRSAGQAVLGYLRGLDFARLDAEQQYRLRRIITSLGRQSVEDVPEQVARRLIADEAIWLALLSRPEESTRRLAARQLSAIFGGPILFDPTADPARRERQIEQLRSRLRP